MKQKKIFHNNTQHPLIIKMLRKQKIKKTLLNLIKDIYKKLRADTKLSSKTLNVLLLRSGTRQGCLILLFLFKIAVEFLLVE